MTEPKTSSEQGGDTPAGFAFAVSAYGLWGFLPIYLRLLDHVPPGEILAHRIIWSVPVAGIVLIALRRTGDILRVLRSPRMLVMGCLTSALISANWGVYVWAIANERAIDAALGYYINPLFSVALGALVLREKLNRLQWIAVALATCAVLTLTVAAGSVPWTSLALTVTWGFYALCKKALPIGPNQGFLLEVLILSVPSLAYVFWIESAGQGHFGPDMWLLLGCGIVTAVPLLLYANGAKGLRLTTIAILQYIAPTLIFLVAVLLFKEPIGQARMIAFPMIWAALVIYTYSILHGRRDHSQA